MPVLPLLLSPLLPEDMLVLADMLPTLPVLSMLPSVRLRLSQRLKLMLVFCMEDMDMVVLDILDLAMLVLDMAMLPLLPMATLLLAMVVLAMLPVATMARGLLMPSLRLMLVCIMEDMDTVLVLAMLGMDMDILVLDMPDMVVMDLDMEDMVLDMAVPSMVKLSSYASKSSKVILLLFSAPIRVGIVPDLIKQKSKIMLILLKISTLMQILLPLL